MSLSVVHDPADVRARCDAFRAAGQRVGLVPTMGALHEGHLSLVRAVRDAGAQRVVATIFVNPLQFGQNEDLDRYPRTLEADTAMLRELGVDLVFAPAPSAMYPQGFQTEVSVHEVTKPLEGTFRPTHFTGVTTVVTKLFNIVGPSVAAFGRKDYQQWQTIRRMVTDLNMPIEVLGCPIVREPDGLAMSSRNRYLSSEERQKALGIIRGLRKAEAAFRGGERDAHALQALVTDEIKRPFDRIDYVSVADPETLVEVSESCGDRVVFLVAAHLGGTRLIDNLVVEA